ncbi:PREDICTED: uncharacterized protein LOC106811203 [Priapulus caudatus]|uniref:Uncharacterized protein LOC106811203 n=1 Tax=Priapulus caudatus TaxID=37621 RepID=A0ABM1EDH0_PRICU|nr:PREDICTED: uncharacterized protein LOC106811203 [Priapulus caudatus]
MKTETWNLTTLCVVSIIVLLTTQTVSGDSTYSEIIKSLAKKNIWWTKRTPDAGNLLPHESSRGYGCEMTTAIFECYVERCVEGFVGCATNAASSEEFASCIMVHRMWQCYVERCVEGFVGCATNAASSEEFASCIMVHRMCGTKCGRIDHPGTMTIAD